MTGKFISFEGPDGAGKTSVLREIIQRLTVAYGDQLLVTREPGGAHNPVAEAIRDVVLSPDYPAMDNKTEALLYAASRREHIQQTIKPALAQDKLVLSDRYVDSSIAYQGAGREIGFEVVLTLNQFAIEDFWPDRTIFLDVRPEIGLQRIQEQRQDEINRLDLDSLEFHQRVYAGYQKLIQINPARFIVINGEQPLPQVVEDTWQAMKKEI
ncbi:tmk protein [Weissella kandleri]|uniref:Thymidylate kinase n=1 Tax=Weissella kandleri TaxID=1616 RepID=A0A0R2JC45_9LACO|nr:dTMP kinase [Weissella kandleri]KRN74883.1 tmk protein [Weissella kandleri]